MAEKAGFFGSSDESRARLESWCRRSVERLSPLTGARGATRLVDAIVAERLGRRIDQVSPEGFQNGAGPTYAEIRAFFTRFAPGVASYLRPGGVSSDSVVRLHRIQIAMCRQIALDNPTTLGRHLAELGFDSRAAIQPGAASAGFVYVNSVEPSLLAQVDLFGWRWSKRISVIVPIPDTDLPRASLATLRTLYPPADLIEIRTEAELRTALEDLPCCVTNQNGAQKALPLNLVLIGDFEEIGPAFVSRGYSAAPAAPFYAFGRAQDMAVRKRSRWVAAQPQLLRVWLTPLRYERRPIWIAQVSSVQGGRFAAAAKEADRIDPAVDEARNDVVQDLFYSQAVARLGFLRGVERVAATEPRTTPDGSTYYTAGQRAVLLFADKPVSLSQIGSFNWETLQATGAGPVPLPR